MPSQTSWLLVDCGYLCHRALHSTGGLAHGGMPTGICFGILRDLESLVDLFGTHRCILAFDSAFSLRQEVYPNYKSSRRNRVYLPEEQAARKLFYEEVNRLQLEILPQAGYKNIFQVRGYEADDILAKVAEDLPAGVDGAIVSADEDLWQCLNRAVVCYNPTTKKAMSAKSFREKWNIPPYQWADVKAFAGCSSDDVEGLDGIGPVNAAKWVAGTLKPTTKAWEKLNAGIAIYNRNIDLVRLPYPGLKLPEVVDDDVTLAKLVKVKADLGIRTRHAVPRVGGLV